MLILPLNHFCIIYFIIFDNRVTVIIVAVADNFKKDFLKNAFYKPFRPFLTYKKDI